MKNSQQERPKNSPRARPKNSQRVRAKKSHEIKVYGVEACSKLLKRRPDGVIRIYLTRSRLKEFSQALKWCAQKSRAYHVVTPDELNRIAKSVHHEGICILAKVLPEPSFSEVLAGFSRNRLGQCLLYLDAVQNPQNIGSIMRVGAHFKVPYLLGENKLLPRLTPSACRVAEGAAELVRLLPLTQPLKVLRQLKELGFTFVATSSHRGDSVYNYKFSPRTLIIVGNEVKGVSKDFFEMADDIVQLPGSGEVESLNVAMATGLVLNEYWRQHKAGRKIV